MGFYYTTSPENAVPGKSWVPPKTHTPGSRLEKRGARFYSATLSRWMSRDPIGESGFAVLLLELASTAQEKCCQPYVFVQNAPTLVFDYLGLEGKKACCPPPGFQGYWNPDLGDSGAGSTLTCADICKLANVELNEGQFGTVVCWGNIKCPCVFDSVGVKVGDCKALDNALTDHENGHLSQTKCDNVCRRLYGASWVDPGKGTENECIARRKTVDDLKKIIEQEKNAKCKQAEQTYVTSVERWLKDHCK